MCLFIHYVTFAKLLFSLSLPSGLSTLPTTCLSFSSSPIGSTSLHPYSALPFHPSSPSHPPPPPTPPSPRLVPEPGGAGRLHGSGPQQRRSPEEPGPGARARQCKRTCVCVCPGDVCKRRQTCVIKHAIKVSHFKPSALSD